MNPDTTKLILFVSVLLILMIGQNSHALTAEEICKQPTFKLWKTQQANRLWTPNKETLSEERSGKLFTYNCFTFQEIDLFFISHEDRIENAHFYPILEMRHQGEPDSDDDC